MASERFEPAALIKSILVHVTVIGLFFVSWKSSEEVVVPKAMPQHIRAVIVTQAPPKKQEPKKQVTPRREKPKPAEPKKPQPKKPEPRPEKRVEPKKSPSKVPAKPTKPTPSTPQQKSEPKKSEPASEPTEDFSDLLKSEMKAMEQQPNAKQPTAPTPTSTQETDTDKVQNEIDQYVGLIQQTISRYWIRPPNARTGMVVTLRINLLPGGELNDVNVVDSSGNAAFDHSAVLAVQKAGRFPVPKDPVLFDRYFRSLKLVFNPTDLRY